MSYYKIKSINIDIKSKKVFITSASSNTTPIIYDKWHAKSFDKYFDDGGIEAIQREILFEFFNRNFQGESTNYGKCIKSFFDKYKGNGDREYQDYLNCTNGDVEFRKSFLNRLYEHYLEYECKRKNKALFVIKIGSSYISKVGRAGATTTAYESHAKAFNCAIAESLQKRFSHANAEMVPVKEQTNF